MKEGIEGKGVLSPLRSLEKCNLMCQFFNFYIEFIACVVSPIRIDIKKAGLFSTFVFIFLITDINECMNTTTCHEDAYCNNTMGSFNCTCHPGYYGDGQTNCTGSLFIYNTFT